MKLELHKNSLFAILLRSPWWVSAIAALLVFGLVRLFMAVGFALFAASPFIIIGTWTAWKEIRRPGKRRTSAALAQARELPWDGFCASLEEAFRRGGYTARRSAVADLELVQQGRVTLVACRRWKAGRTGVEPLREFDAATREQGAFGRIYIAAGEVSGQARAFAKDKGIRLMEEQELGELLSG
jgi:restriction system protein